MEIKYNLKETYWRPILKIKAQGLLCPEPIMMLHKAIQDAQEGERIELYATDPSTEKDVDRFCEFLGHNLLKKNKKSDIFYFLIQKNEGAIEK